MKVKKQHAHKIIYVSTHSPSAAYRVFEDDGRLMLEAPGYSKDSIVSEQSLTSAVAYGTVLEVLPPHEVLP